MRKPIAMLAAFYLGSAVAAEAAVVDFDSIPALVRERNDHAKGAALLAEAEGQQKGVLRRSLAPTLGFRAGAETFKTGSRASRAEPFGFLEAGINLYRGGRDKLADEAVEARVSAASADADRILREEIKKARQAYWTLVSQREVLALLSEAKAANSSNQGAASTRIRAGLATETDRIEFEMFDIELGQDLARAKLEAESTERELRVLLGLDEGVQIQTQAQVGHEEKDKSLTSKVALDEHPSVAALTFGAIEADVGSRQLGRWWWPRLDAYGSHGLNTFREREFEPASERVESVVGLQISMDLFDGFISRTEASRKALEAEGLRREARQTASELRAQVERSQAELELTHTLIHDSEAAIKRSASYLARTLDEYKRGVKNSPDVLAASERNLSMRRRFAELRRDYQLARAELMAVLGQ